VRWTALNAGNVGADGCLSVHRFPTLLQPHLNYCTYTKYLQLGDANHLDARSGEQVENKSRTAAHGIGIAPKDPKRREPKTDKADALSSKFCRLFRAVSARDLLLIYLDIDTRGARNPHYICARVQTPREPDPFIAPETRPSSTTFQSVRSPALQILCDQPPIL
jgi:hypothetical protein